MKELKLLHESEYVSSMLSYRYKQHAWEWDCKFWVVGNKICVDLEGKCPLGELDEKHAAMIKKYTPLIEQREKVNKNWAAYNECRKRSCLCKKSCILFCNCGECKGKITVCDKKERKI